MGKECHRMRNNNEQEQVYQVRTDLAVEARDMYVKSEQKKKQKKNQKK